MADGAITSLRSKVSEAEWNARVELAALYRLVALHGWDDMIFTHISARVPGPEHHFLINPYGWYFEEMTASLLVKVDLEGNVVQETSNFINPAGFTIHSAVHAAREDVDQRRRSPVGAGQPLGQDLAHVALGLTRQGEEDLAQHRRQLARWRAGVAQGHDAKQKPFARIGAGIARQRNQVRIGRRRGA